MFMHVPIVLLRLLCFLLRLPVIILWLIMVADVAASGCGCSNQKVKQSIESASTVFIGQVVAARAQIEGTYYRPPGGRVWISEEDISPEFMKISESKVVIEAIWARFVNVRILKGSFDATHEIRMGNTICLMAVYVGGIYLVISEDGKTAGYCEGAKELTPEDAESIKTLDDLLKTYGEK